MLGGLEVVARVGGGGGGGGGGGERIKNAFHNTYGGWFTSPPDFPHGCVTIDRLRNRPMVLDKR